MMQHVVLYYYSLGQANLITCFSSMNFKMSMRKGGHYSLFNKLLM